MANVFVTGSSDGIGARTARDLAAAGHRVVLHARDATRARDALTAVPDAVGVCVGDLASLAQTTELATAACEYGPYDAIIHNAGVSRAGSTHRRLTEDGMETTFQVNVLAPYLLTALIPLPARLVYLTSGLESEGVAELDDLQRERRPWDGMAAYCDSKLYDVVLAFAFAARWPHVLSNAVDPGWIRTRLGGPNATDGLPEGADTQVWLATSDAPEATVTGHYVKRRRALPANPAAYDPVVQDRLLAACAALTGVTVPA